MSSLVTGLLLLLSLAAATPASADGPSVQVQPAGNAVVTTAPQQVLLTFAAPPDPARSHVAVFTADRQPVQAGSLYALPADPMTLAVELPTLAPGVFTVVWSATSAADNTVQQGSFGFAFDPSQVAASVVRQPQPRFAYGPLERSIPRWLAFVGIMAFVGATSLRSLVWRQVLRQTDGARRGATSLALLTDRRLLLLAAGSLLLFLPSTLVQLVFDASAAAKRPFWSPFDLGLVAAFLATPGAGYLWSARLLATALMALTILPAAAAALRTGWRYDRERVGAVMGLGLLFGMAELLVRTLPGSIPADLPRAIFTSLADWGHLLGSGVWIGGLIALVATVPLARAAQAGPAASLSAIIRRFSVVALTCVGVQTLTGLWTSWIHVGSPLLLFTTLYGQTLLAKLALVAALMGLGAVNLLWLLPRVETIREAGAWRESHLTIALRHFRAVIATEAAIGVAILLIVPFLSGSARNQAAQIQAADLARTARAGDLAVTFTPSALQPGMVEYDVQLPGQEHGPVTVTFDAPDLGVPATVVTADERGPGLFRAAGFYTSMVGPWRARVSVLGSDGQPRAATFDLAIRPEPVTAPAPAPPPILLSTWAYGIAETVLVALLLLTAARVADRVSARARSAAAGSRPARRLPAPPLTRKGLVA
ncbi:MAG: CopD family protein [Chloroflexota bacterium]